MRIYSFLTIHFTETKIKVAENKWFNQTGYCETEFRNQDYLF